MFRVGQSRRGVQVSLVGVPMRKFSEYPEPEFTLLSSVGDDVHHRHYWASAGVLHGAPVVDLLWSSSMIMAMVVVSRSHSDLG